MGPVAPVDLDIKAASTTSVQVKVTPPRSSAAEYFEVFIEDPRIGPTCRAYFRKSPNSCTFKDLKPGQSYRFSYLLGVRRGFQDIISESRHKSLTMPSVCKKLSLVFVRFSLALNIPNVSPVLFWN